MQILLKYSEIQYFNCNWNPFYAITVLLNYNNISDPPRVKLNLGNGIDRNRISEGQDVYMDCEIRANPRIYKVEWIHNVSCIFSSNLKYWWLFRTILKSYYIVEQQHLLFRWKSFLVDYLIWTYSTSLEKCKI